MKASEARKISDDKAIVLSDVIDQIRQCAEHGETCHFTPPNRDISTDIITQLIGLGYSVKEHTDQFNGFKMYVISW